MKNPRLSREAQHIDEDNWYYEETKGILLFHNVYDNLGSFLRTENFLIPWNKMGTSFRRYSRAKAAKKVKK